MSLRKFNLKISYGPNDNRLRKSRHSNVIGRAKPVTLRKEPGGLYHWKTTEKLLG